MGGTSSLDPMIRPFESAMLKTGAAIDKPLDGHAGWVQAVAYSTDGGDIISGSSDKPIQVWDAKTDAPIGMPLDAGEICCLLSQWTAHHFRIG